MATWMAALQHGATEADIDTLYKAVEGIIEQLMGRGALYEWTKLQLVQACLRHQTPVDYESFVRGVRYASTVWLRGRCWFTHYMAASRLVAANIATLIDDWNACSTLPKG